jgi:crotonobetainyl-CoA:carnitine CoA-transferase CaiB-like acyl-CoA transferase
MSGFAAITGEPDGPPTLPPFGLADGVAALATSSAVMMALYHRDAHGGQGQVIDLAIIEPILTVLGAQPTVYDQLGIVQTRTGNRSVNNAPRNTYRTRDSRWVAVSTSAQNVAERVMKLVGHAEVIAEPWFADGRSRAERADLLDEYVGSWIAERDLDEVLEAFETAEAAIAPVYDISQIMEDPQFQALQSIIEVEDPELGTVKMQNVMYRMTETPGRVRWAGCRRGEHNEEIYRGELGLTASELERLSAAGVI